MSNKTTKPTRGHRVARAAGSSFIAASIALSGVAVGVPAAHADGNVQQVEETAKDLKVKDLEAKKLQEEKEAKEKEAKEKRDAEEKAEAAAKKQADEEAAAEKAAAEKKAAAEAAEKKAAAEAAEKKAAAEAAAKKAAADAAAKKVAADKAASAQDKAGATTKAPLESLSAEEASSDLTGPTVTVKPESEGSDGVYRSVSFKLNDPSKVDYVTVNGLKKDLSDNVWSDLNGVRPGVFGAVEGVNTLVVFDTLGNSTTITFTLEAQFDAPTVKIDSIESDRSGDGGHYTDEQVTVSVSVGKGTFDLVRGHVAVYDANGKSVGASVKQTKDPASWQLVLDAGMAPGTYHVLASAIDANGNTAQQEKATFEIVAYQAPGVEITAPGHGTESTVGETVDVDALVTEGTHGTASVVLKVTDAAGAETVHPLHGVSSLARSVGTTYRAALEGLEPGTYELKATVADTTGHEAGEVSSESVSITVKATDASGGDEDGDDTGGGDDGGSGTDTDGTDTDGTDTDGTGTDGTDTGDGSGTSSGSTDTRSTGGLADGGSIGDAALVLPAEPSLQGSAGSGSADSGSTGSAATTDASSGTSTGALATTGADTAGILALMGGLLAAGLAALGFRRRKEEETEV
jgi:LPXTG-motif cell wall-anchored protein